jgi:four helix bundle protein
MHQYKELSIWKKSVELGTEIYKLTKQFPSDERFGLISQLRRAAVSVPSNIAEGAGRKSDREFCQFLSISYGSLCELDTQLIISTILGYVKEDEINKYSEKIVELQKMIFVLINKLSGGQRRE